MDILKVNAEIEIGFQFFSSKTIRLSYRKLLTIMSKTTAAY